MVSGLHQTEHFSGCSKGSEASFYPLLLKHHLSPLRPAQLSRRKPSWMRDTAVGPEDKPPSPFRSDCPELHFTLNPPSPASDLQPATPSHAGHPYPPPLLPRLCPLPGAASPAGLVLVFHRPGGC